CEKFRMDTYDEGLFVVAAVENADVTAIWKALHAPPEIIVIQVLGGGRLEGKNLTALRVDTGHDVLDGAILAGGVHGLKNKEQAPFVLRIKHVLQFRKRVNADFHGLLDARLVLGLESQGFAGIKVLERKPFPVDNTELLRKFVSFIDELFCFHGQLVSRLQPSAPSGRWNTERAAASRPPKFGSYDLIPGTRCFRGRCDTICFFGALPVNEPREITCVERIGAGRLLAGGA